MVFFCLEWLHNVCEIINLFKNWLFFTRNAYFWRCWCSTFVTFVNFYQRLKINLFLNVVFELLMSHLLFVFRFCLNFWNRCWTFYYILISTVLLTVFEIDFSLLYYFTLLLRLVFEVVPVILKQGREWLNQRFGCLVCFWGLGLDILWIRLRGDFDWRFLG